MSGSLVGDGRRDACEGVLKEEMVRMPPDTEEGVLGFRFQLVPAKS